MNYNSNVACSHIFHERFLKKYWKNQYFSSIGRKNCGCSVAKLCLTLRNPMDCGNTSLPCSSLSPGVYSSSLSLMASPTGINDAIQPSHPLLALFSFCPQSFPASESLAVSQCFASGGQNIGASPLASVLPMNIQD